MLVGAWLVGTAGCTQLEEGQPVGHAQDKQGWATPETPQRVSALTERLESVQTDR